MKDYGQGKVSRKLVQRKSLNSLGCLLASYLVVNLEACRRDENDSCLFDSFSIKKSKKFLLITIVTRIQNILSRLSNLLFYFSNILL
jgi:hypothetical protein